MKKLIAKKRNSEYSIIVPKNAHVVEKTAAEELASYLEKALGAKIPIVSEENFSGKGIYIGKTAFAKENGIEGKEKENWIMKMVGDNLVLTGGEKIGDRGIIYSVYHFIEDILGVRWFSPYEEDVLTLKKLSLDADFEREGTPDFFYRKPLLCSGCGIDGYINMVRNRVNSISPLDDGLPNGPLDENVRRFGDPMHVGRPHHVHVMGKLFPASKYFDEHPEWWAWNKVNNKHMIKGNYCFSNEEFLDAFVQKLTDFIEEDIKLSEEKGIEFPFMYSLSPDDLSTAAFCQCEKCEAIIERSGYGGYLMDFGNRILKKIKAKYPFVRLEMIAYADFIEPPKDDMLPDENLDVELAHVHSDIIRPISASSNKTYKRLLDSWADICRRAGSKFYIYDYMYNIRINYPLALSSRIAALVRDYKAADVNGVFIETQNEAADMWELNNYMLTHLLEDASLDEVALRDDFLVRYYGKAAKYVKKYIGLLDKCAERNEVFVYCCGEGTPFNYIDAETAIEGDKLLTKALSAVSGDETKSRRIKWLRKPLDTVILLKFADLKDQAERDGLKFKFVAEEVRTRVIKTIDEHIAISKLASKASLGAERDYLENVTVERENFAEYPELSDIPRENIYDFPMKKMTKFIQKIVRTIYGHSVVYDETVGHDVMKLSYDVGTGFGWDLEMIPTAKDDPIPRPIRFFLMQDEKETDVIEFFKEDLNHDKYVLYKIGTCKDVLKNPHTRLLLFAEHNVLINLRGIAVTHPFDECDVYLSMKFSGEKYGGRADEENAVYFDRMMVVKK